MRPLKKYKILCIFPLLLGAIPQAKVIGGTGNKTQKGSFLVSEGVQLLAGEALIKEVSKLSKATKLSQAAGNVNSIPGSKGFKRAPTKEELDILKKANKIRW